MIEIVAYAPEHMDKIRQRDVYNGFSKMKESIAGLMAAKSGLVLTLLDGETVLAVVGYTLLHEKLAEFWAVTSDDIKKKPVSFHKCVKSLLRSVSIDLDLNRAQIVVKNSFQAGKRWVEALGFSSESVMKCFGPNGEDYVMFVNLRKVA